MIGQLAARDTGVAGNPYLGWGQVPRGAMNYMRGGGIATGAQCGIFTGGLAVIEQICGASADVMAVDYLRWFENYYSPSNAAYVDKASGTWTLRTDGAAIAWDNTNAFAPSKMMVLNNAPKVKTKTTTCHGAHTKWKVAATSWNAAKGALYGNNDRCAKCTYDGAFKIAQMINQWVAQGKTWTAGPADPVISSCSTPSCHGGTYPSGGISGGKITCTPCHDGAEAITLNHGL